MTDAFASDLNIMSGSDVLNSPSIQIQQDAMP